MDPRVLSSWSCSRQPLGATEGDSPHAEGLTGCLIILQGQTGAWIYVPGNGLDWVLAQVLSIQPRIDGYQLDGPFKRTSHISNSGPRNNTPLEHSIFRTDYKIQIPNRKEFAGWVGASSRFLCRTLDSSALAVTALGLIQAAFGFDKRKNGIRMPPQHSEIAKQEADRSS